MYKALKIIIPVLLIQLQLNAQRSVEQRGLYGSMNLGLGIVNGNITNENTTTTAQFAMHVNVGVFVSRSVQAGITLSGWLFERYSLNPDIYQGESLSNRMIHLQIYPVSNYKMYLKGAYGLSKYTNMRPQEDSGKGHGFMAAVGYEKEAGQERIFWGIQLSYNSGQLKYTNSGGNNSLLYRRFQTIDLTLYLAID